MNLRREFKPLSSITSPGVAIGPRWGHRRQALSAAASRMAALAVLALLVASRPAYPWGAFRGLAGVKVTDTHQQIMLAAFNLFLNDPRIKSLTGLPIGGGRVVWIDHVLEYEGVSGSIVTLRPYGPGPDADGSTLYSCHWFNPLTGRGLAPQSAGDWYGRFIQAILGIAGGDEDAYKGLAWSAHFLADMFVPYHTIGIPAEEAAARIGSQSHILSDAEVGPAFLWQSIPPGPGGTIPGTPFGDLARSYERWERDGWGIDSNFRESLAIFDLNRQAAGAGASVNYVDWFDPWYWNGMTAKTNVFGPLLSDPNTDPGRAIFSTHASYEALAHSRFLETGGYDAFSYDIFVRGVTRYDPLWKNAPPDYSFSGTSWQAQAWQVQDFAAKAAMRTRQNLEAYWRAPETAVRGAVEAVYTMMRSAYTALQPAIQAGRDPARPNDGLVITANVQNLARENCHDVRLRLRVMKDGGAAVQDIQPLPEPVAGPGSGSLSWFVQVNPNEEWTIVVEAVGVYDRTPDLQYGLSYAQYRPEPQNPTDQLIPQNARPVEQAEAADFAGYYTYTDPLRSYDEFHGEIWVNSDGTFRGNDYLPKVPETRRGTGIWTFDPATLTISLDWQPGGDFAGPVRGNTADFTIDGHWSNGGAGTLRFQRR